jgi:hypothetical protein
MSRTDGTAPHSPVQLPGTSRIPDARIEDQAGDLVDYLPTLRGFIATVLPDLRRAFAVRVGRRIAEQQ